MELKLLIKTKKPLKRGFFLYGKYYLNFGITIMMIVVFFIKKVLKVH